MKSMKRLSILCGVLLLGLTLSGCGFLDRLKARDHLNRGVKAFTSKQYDTAIEEFQETVRLDPELVDGYLYLATAYRAQFIPFVQTADNLRRGQQAIATFEKVMELDQGNVNAIMNIADLYRNLSQPEEAKNWYRKLMEVEEDDSQALYGLAVIDYNLAEEQTGKDGENVENLTEEHRVELNLFVDEAIGALQQALNIRPDYTDAMEYLNLLYREKSELAVDEEEKRKWDREALKLAQQALQLRREQQREDERRRREFLATEEESP